jgi:hypothetical protein
MSAGSSISDGVSVSLSKEAAGGPRQDAEKSSAEKNSVGALGEPKRTRGTVRIEA